MRQLLISIFIILAHLSCKDSAKNQANSGLPNDTTSVSVKAAKPSHLTLESLQAYVGKTPGESDLFNKYQLLPRIEKLLGKDFADFKNGWEVETPIKGEGDVYYTTACKKDKCESISIFLVMDTANDNVNVYLFNQGKIKTWEETSIIGLTDVTAAIYEKLKSQMDKATSK